MKYLHKYQDHRVHTEQQQINSNMKDIQLKCFLNQRHNGFIHNLHRYDFD